MSSNMTPTLGTIGFIGLGIMGAPMAGHLQAAGHRLVVHTRSKLPQALSDGATTRVAHGKLVAHQAEVIFLMLPDTPDVESVLFGENGVAAGLSRGKAVVDMSSISPIALRCKDIDCDEVETAIRALADLPWD